MSSKVKKKTTEMYTKKPASSISGASKMDLPSVWVVQHEHQWRQRVSQPKVYSVRAKCWQYDVQQHRPLQCCRNGCYGVTSSPCSQDLRSVYYTNYVCMYAR